MGKVSALSSSTTLLLKRKDGKEGKTVEERREATSLPLW